MSEIRVTTVSDTAGTGPVTLTKQSAAKAFVRYVQDTPAITQSFNVASVTDSSTGNSVVNYTSAFDAAGYPTPSNNSFTASSLGVWSRMINAGDTNVITNNESAAAEDNGYNLAAIGDLA